MALPVINLVAVPSLPRYSPVTLFCQSQLSFGSANWFLRLRSDGHAPYYYFSLDQDVSVITGANECFAGGYYCNLLCHDLVRMQCGSFSKCECSRSQLAQTNGHMSLYITVPCATGVSSTRGTGGSRGSGLVQVGILWVPSQRKRMSARNEHY